MALAHRVNQNYSPLLTTFYCKCIVNKRFQSWQRDRETRSRREPGKSNGTFRTFNEMMEFRRKQARKSVLIKVSTFDHILQVHGFVSRFGTVARTFPFTTLNDQNFLLLEMEAEKQVESFQLIAFAKLSPDCTYTTTPLFYYQGQQNTYSHDSSVLKNICTHHHSTFRVSSAEEIRKHLRSLTTPTEQMMALCEMLTVTDLNIRLRFHTAEQISYYISKLFSNLHVLPFGSSVNGFGQIGCDLDLLCQTDGKKQTQYMNQKGRFLFCTQPLYFTEKNEQKEFLELISMMMRMCVPGISGLKKILEARVPIIKFYNMNTNMQCDLSCTNSVALYMSELLYIYSELDWRVKPLVCTIRKWARNANITRETPGHWLTNFSLTLLIMFYLQTRNVLPSLNTLNTFSVNTLYTNDTQSENKPWHVQWRRNTKCNNQESLHSLLFGFFEYYSMFDFKMQAICIREAKLKPKSDQSPLFIYNPFNPTLNVSKNVTMVEIVRMIDQFRQGLQTMLESEDSTVILNLINCAKPSGLSAQKQFSGNKVESFRCNDQVKGPELMDEELFDKIAVNNLTLYNNLFAIDFYKARSTCKYSFSPDNSGRWTERCTFLDLINEREIGEEEGVKEVLGCWRMVRLPSARLDCFVIPENTD
ncbi:mitochondrial poly(A) polymerase [Xylocopa sonorina]|uniref:mitochondrial poly(A) polymerase n=1 Tax=Xylocopa sonorina TaxID=1818115 RepID=UPI00403AE57D